MKYYLIIIFILLIVLPSSFALKQGETTVIDIDGNDYAVYFETGETAENIDLLITGFVEAEPLNNGQTIIKQTEQSCYYISFLSTNSGSDLMVSECESIINFQEAGESIKIYPYAGQEFCISATLHSIDGDTFLENLNVPEECMVDVICGNGIIELNEECDDGNLESDDGCSMTCSSEEIIKVQEKGVIIDGDCYKLLSEQDVNGLNIEINLMDETFCSPSPDPNPDPDPDPDPNPNPTPNPGGDTGGSGGGSRGGSNSMAGVPLIIPNTPETQVVSSQQPISNPGFIESDYETQKTQQELSQLSKQKLVQEEIGAEIQQPGTIKEEISIKPIFISVGLIVLIIGLIVFYLFYKHRHNSLNLSKTESTTKLNANVKGVNNDSLLSNNTSSLSGNKIIPPTAPKLPARYEQQLRKYISINIRKGLSVDQIVSNLTKSGWKKEDIEKIMSK